MCVLCIYIHVCICALKTLLETIENQYTKVCIMHKGTHPNLTFCYFFFHSSFIIHLKIIFFLFYIHGILTLGATYSIQSDDVHEFDVPAAGDSSSRSSKDHFIIILIIIVVVFLKVFLHWSLC